jgi:hypothetical protein
MKRIPTTPLSPRLIIAVIALLLLLAFILWLSVSSGTIYTMPDPW